MSTERYQEARRRLYESALRLFREKGFDATSADDIAADAGLSRATFFNHFGNKAAVLRFFGQDLEAKVCTQLGEATSATSPLAELRRILLLMATEAEAQRANLRIVLVHSLQDGTYFSEPSPARARIFQHLAGLIAEAQKRREARTDLAAAALATQVVGLYNNAIIGILFGQQSAADAVGRLWAFALGGLGKCPPAPPGPKPKSGR